MTSDVGAKDRGAIVVVLLFAVLFALTEVTPVSNLVALPGFYDYYGIGEATPWILLVLGVVLPVVIYLVAVLLGRGVRGSRVRASSRSRSPRRSPSSLA